MRWLTADPLLSFLKTVLKENTMSTISTTSAVVNATIPATVVKHDTSAMTDAKPSIKLGANAKVKIEKKAAVTTPMECLQTMESATRNWEANELAASNKRLYC